MEKKEKGEIVQREADKEEWSPSGVHPQLSFPSSPVISNINPFYVTSVRSNIHELVVWASAVCRPNTFDFKNHFALWLFQPQIVNNQSISFWVLFSILFFKTKQETPHKPYLIHFVISGEGGEKCLFSLSPLTCWVRISSFSYPRTMETLEAFLSLLCTRPMCIGQKGFGLPVDLSTVSPTSLPHLLQKSPFSWMNNLKIWRTGELFLMLSFSLFITPFSLKGQWILAEIPKWALSVRRKKSV